MAESKRDIPVRKEAGGGEKVDEEGGVPLTSQCSVCTAPAAEHRHYGAVSCYSCRSISHTYPSLQCKTAQPSSFAKICLPIFLVQSLFSAWCSQTEEMHLWTQPVQDQPTQPDQLQAVSLPALPRDWYETRQGEQISQ